MSLLLYYSDLHSATAFACRLPPGSQRFTALILAGDNEPIQGFAILGDVHLANGMPSLPSSRSGDADGSAA